MENKALNNIRVVLAGARRSGNVGLAARGMKNTGLSHLTLVGCTDHRSKTAMKFGAPAKEIMDAAVVRKTLGDALKDCSYSVGFTRRVGKMRLPLEPFLDLVPGILAKAKTGRVALLFGNERTGLSTEELSHCDAAAYLPSSPLFPSMNLSHAVMLAGYELLKASGQKGLGGIAGPRTERYPTQQQVAHMFTEVEDILRRLDYQDMPRFRLLSTIVNNLQRMSKRAMPTCGELNMLRGILSRLDQRLPKRTLRS